MTEKRQTTRKSTAKPKAKGKEKRNGRKKDNGINVVIGGKLLTLEFFKRNAWLIMISVGIVIALIGQRYANHSKMREIKQLKEELARVKSEKLQQKSQYMSLIRENKMMILLRERNIQLGYQEQPPYSLSRQDGVKNE